MAQSSDALVKMINSIINQAKIVEMENREIADEMNNMANGPSVYQFNNIIFKEPLTDIEKKKKKKYEEAEKEAKWRARKRERDIAAKVNMTIEEFKKEEERKKKEDEQKRIEKKKKQAPQKFSRREVHDITGYDRGQQIPAATRGWSFALFASLWIMWGWSRALMYDPISTGIITMVLITLAAVFVSFIIFLVIFDTDKWVRDIGPIELFKFRYSKKFNNLKKLLDLCIKYNAWVDMYVALLDENPKYVPLSLEGTSEFLKEYRTKLKMQLLSESSNIKSGGKLFDLPDELMNPEIFLMKVMQQFSDQKELQKIVEELEKED